MSTGQHKAPAGGLHPLEVFARDEQRAERRSVEIPDPVTTDEPVTTEAAAAAIGGSLRDRLAAKAHELEAGRTTDMRVPGVWDGLLWIHVRPPGDLRAFARRPSDEAWIMLCTAEVYAIDDDGEHVHLADSWGDPQLGELLGMPGLVGEDLVERALGGEELLIRTFANDLLAWAQGKQNQLEALLGE